MDGKAFAFPFDVVDSEIVGKPEQASKTESHRLIVSIGKLRLAEWGIRTGDLEKVLFEFGRRYVVELIKTNALPAQNTIQMPIITVATHPETKCPFDASRIREPEGAESEVEIEPSRIGFK